MPFNPKKRYKFLCCCGAGLGSSQMLKSRLVQVLRAKGVDATVDVCSVSEGMLSCLRYDATFCNIGLAKSFEKAKAKGAKLVTLNNVIDVKEIEAALDAFFA